MNRGVLQSSPVQQMMAGNPNNWWNVNTMPSPPQASPSFFSTSSNFLTPCAPSSSLPLPSCQRNCQELPESWSLLLTSGMVSDQEEKVGKCQVQSKKLENWEQQMLRQAPKSAPIVEGGPVNSYMYGQENDEFEAAKPTWSQIVPASSPKSCATSFSSSMLDFSNNNIDARPPPPDPSSECTSTEAGGAFKKARVQPPTTQSTFKVRKEKLGDRITALHQLVSPFGKTDTASVLLEAIGYIRFLQSQIEALSLPYLGSGSGNMRQLRQSDSEEEAKKELRSRGLCLVPVSCTLQVGSDNGADYWAPAFVGGISVD